MIGPRTPPDHPFWTRQPCKRPGRRHGRHLQTCRIPLWPFLRDFTQLNPQGLTLKTGHWKLTDLPKFWMYDWVSDIQARAVYILRNFGELTAISIFESSKTIGVALIFRYFHTQNWLVVWNIFDHFSIQSCHTPTWRFHIFQRFRYTNPQPYP